MAETHASEMQHARATAERVRQGARESAEIFMWIRYIDNSFLRQQAGAEKAMEDCDGVVCEGSVMERSAGGSRHDAEA